MNFIRAQQNYDDPNSLASRFRRARMRHVTALIQAIHAERGACRIVDLGGRPDYWRAIDRSLLEACKVTITTVNLEPQAPVDDPMFDQRVGDALAFDAADNAFDLAHSNSVVEHVGDWPQMERFAAETARLASRYYVQTPYFWFPIEPHFSAPFFHWLPEAVRARKLMRRPLGFAPQAADMAQAMRLVQHARLLDRGMMAQLFPDAAIEAETVGPLIKSLMAIRR